MLTIKKEWYHSSQNHSFLLLITLTDDKSNNAQAKSKAQGKKSSNSMYHGVDGNPISKDILADITQFQVKNKRKLQYS